MQILLVVAHPRPTSLTHAAAGSLAQALAAQGHGITLADLHAEGFDPRMTPEDEPDWVSERQRFSPAVEAEIARLEAHDAIAMVFPLWWWSLPAMLKGWIDRVWNRGVAYGPRTLAGKRSLMLAVSADSPEGLAKRGYDAAIATQLQVGILDYCGMAEGRVALLTGSLDGPERQQALLAEAAAWAEHWPEQ